VVAISLLTLVPGELGGSETYARELLRALRASSELDVQVLAPPVAPDAGEGLPTIVQRDYGVARTPGERLLAMTRASLRRRDIAAAVVHYPLTVALPRVRVPSIVTLHDVQHLDLPQLFSRAERAWRRVAWHRSVRSAARVIVLSEFVRDRAIEKLRLRPGAIRVVPPGVDHARFRPGDAEREPFLLYPARPWPHKNHARLYEAFVSLRAERPGLRLVLTGGGDFGAVPEGVEVRGRVSDDELAHLYRTAAAVVFPSLYEGFGQPPLEAMASGCPVACSNVAALPEVAADAACLFDPRDPNAIAEGIRDVLDTPDGWRAKGLARAAQFSWEATARRTEAVYSELA
jgi:glycosyltransferase involved in cell wall biosynthesis